MQTILSIALDAVAYAMALFIICIGLSLTMGLMRLVNLAHGAFAMIAGYIASYAARDLGMGYAAALCLAILGTVAISLPLERLLYRRIYGASQLTQVLMTIGITFCIIGAVNYAFGPTLKTIPLPAVLAQPVDLGFRTIAAHRLFVIACGIVVAGTIPLWRAFWASVRKGSMRRASRSPSVSRHSAVSWRRSSCPWSPTMPCATW
jgi:branched-chain amino acid transport system permease protein